MAKNYAFKILLRVRTASEIHVDVRLWLFFPLIYQQNQPSLICFHVIRVKIVIILSQYNYVEIPSINMLSSVSFM